MSKMSLLNTVIKGGYCIGCGACAAVTSSTMKMKMNEHLCLQAYPQTNSTEDQDYLMSLVCPFSDNSINENVLGQELYSTDGRWDEKLGHYISTYAGSVTDQTLRANSSSGGLGTWITVTLFERKLIDGVVHIHKIDDSDKDKRLFKYSISRSAEEIQQGAKTRYYPIELSEVVQMIKEQDGRYLIVGLPCFIKSIRLLTRYDEVLSQRIKFCLGLVCGHLKSAHFATLFSWQFGIRYDELQAIDFRAKLPGLGSNRYGVNLKGIVGGNTKTVLTPPISKLYGTSWGYGLLKYNACDYCDDVVAETADATIGDAWLPQYVADSGGTNILIIRSKLIGELVQQGIDSGSLRLDEVDAEEVIKSQSAGFRHRREGLAYRLYLKDKEKIWRPKKRVQAALTLSEKAQKIQRGRLELALESHKIFSLALKENNFKVFQKKMDPLIGNYDKLYIPLWRRIARKVKRMFLKNK